MRLEITVGAYQDLDEIEAYTARVWGPQQAEKYLNTIYAALDRLLESHGQFLKSDNRISENLFFYRVEKHFIFCDIDKDRLSILSIQHVARDLPARIGDLESRLAEEAAVLHQKAKKATSDHQKSYIDTSSDDSSEVSTEKS